ncbi:MAG: TonB-dependent receptor [Deltaproteobacteria bacterium]|nr:TonB-dependent receptor [Deltaproteobacteria bacterium]
MSVNSNDRKTWRAPNYLAVIIVLFLTMTGFSTHVLAKGNQVFINIPSATAEKTLDEFAQQTKFSFIYSPADVENVYTQAVSGNYAPVDALQIMLDGTGLVTEQVSENTITIRKNVAETVLDAQESVNAELAENQAESVRSDEQAESSPSESYDDYMLEDTVITATKTGATKLQETPLSISSLDDELIKRRKVYTLSELSQYVPNTDIRSDGVYSRTYIRGVGNNFPMVGTESGVAVYLDGVYLERGLGGGNSFFDLERVEVLRGPQGTLYGRNATGGAVNIITKKPADELEITAGIEIGSFDFRRFDASLSGPIIGNNVKGRITISDSNSDSPFKNLTTGGYLGDSEYTALRGSLEIIPADWLDIVLRASYYNFDGGGNAVKSLGGGWYQPGYVPPPGLRNFEHNADEKRSVEDRLFSGHITIRLPRDFTLRSITTYDDRNFDMLYDLDRSPVHNDIDYRDHEMSTISQEIQVDGRLGKFNIVSGVYYYRYSEDFFQHYSYGILGPGLDNLWLEVPVKFKTTAYAAYGNVEYPLTDRLGVSAGLRYSYEEKNPSGSLDTYMTDVFGWFGPAGAAVQVGDIYRNEEKDWSAWTPKFGIDYKLNDDMMIFATAARGFRSGVFWYPNLLTPLDVGVEVDPEYVWNYEVGFKSDWFDKRLRANIAVFYAKYTDMQVSTTLAGWSVYQNAAESTMKGIELELMARPIPGLTLNYTGSYFDGTYDEFGLEDASGNQMMRAPKWAFSMGAQYTIPLQEYGFLTLRGDLNWRDRIYWTHLEDINQSLEETTYINGLIQFETAGGRWSIEAWGKNLADEDYISTVTVTDGTPSIEPNENRSFGARLVFKY